MASEEKTGEVAIERILTAAAVGSAAVEGPCLDDGQIIDFALELMEESNRVPAARHVETCPQCLDEVITLIEERRYWERHVEGREGAPPFLPAREAERAADGTPEGIGKGPPPRRR